MVIGQSAAKHPNVTPLPKARKDEGERSTTIPVLGFGNAARLSNKGWQS